MVDDTVAIHFPSEPDFGLEMDLVYRPHGDAVDMKMVIRPSMNIEKFEIFFASYIVEAFDETWVSLTNEDGSEQLMKLNNRAVLNRTFGAVRDEAARANIRDGRYGEKLGEGIHKDIEHRPFGKPVLVARNSQNGFSLVFLCDPRATTYLTGQYHGWDTAHDWCYGQDLVAGQEMVADTRLVYRQFADPGMMDDGISDLWRSFVNV